MTDKKTMWDSAARAGLVLGCVSIAYMVVSGLLTKYCTQGVAVLLGNITSFVIWGVKFYACIALMRYFLMRFSIENAEADRTDLKMYGRLIALLSALIYSGFTLAYFKFIAPDSFSDAILALQDKPMMTSATLSEMESMIPRMPAISFFSNFIWCYLFGSILTYILVGTIMPDNPFADGSGTEDENKTNE